MVCMKFERLPLKFHRKYLTSRCHIANALELHLACTNPSISITLKFWELLDLSANRHFWSVPRYNKHRGWEKNEKIYKGQPGTRDNNNEPVLVIANMGINKHGIKPRLLSPSQGLVSSRKTLIARFMGPTWGRQDPGGPHVLCYLGSFLSHR